MFELPSDDEVKEVLGDLAESTTEESSEVQETTVLETESVEVDTEEDKAIAAKSGWKEREGGKTAKQFIGDGELIRKLESAAEEAREHRKTVDILLSRLEKSEKLAYEKAYRDIEAKRAQAFQEQDADAFNAYDKELRQMDVELATNPVQDTKSLVRDFEIRNKDWYDITDPDKYELVEAANRESQRLAALGVPPVEQLQKVEQYIKKKYANHTAFANPNRQVSSPVSKSEAPAKKAEPKLTENQEKAFRAIRDKLDKTYTREQYLKDRG